MGKKKRDRFSFQRINKRDQYCCSFVHVHGSVNVRNGNRSLLYFQVFHQDMCAI